MQRALTLAVLTLASLGVQPALAYQESREDELAKHYKEIEAQAKEVLTALNASEQDLQQRQQEYEAVRSLLQDVELQARDMELSKPRDLKARLQTQRSDLRIQKAEYKIRRHAMEQQLVQLVDRTEAEIASDPLVRKLEEIIPELEASWKSVERKFQVIELMVELEQRRELVRERAGGDLIRRLRERILEADIELAVLDMRGKVLEEEFVNASAQQEDWMKMARRQMELESRHLQVQGEWKDRMAEIERLREVAAQLKVEQESLRRVLKK